MLKKLALKKLKSSDLSFFKSYLTKHPAAKQKGFNLDLRVMEGVFYPALRGLLTPLPKKATHVDLTLYGPDGAGGYSLSRKVKIDAKNIRLNGEIVDAPVSEPTRFDCLAPDDFAIFEFSGEPLPVEVKAVLVAAASKADAELHAHLLKLLPAASDSMMVLEQSVLDQAVVDSNLSAAHPVRDWLDGELLEEVGFGDTKAAVMLNKRRQGRGISPTDFKVGRESAERTGLLGEELLDLYLKGEVGETIDSYVWVAQENAISPYDFFVSSEGSARHVDAKSTSGRFGNPIYLSSAEIQHAVTSGIPYDICRLYEVTESSAKLRIAHNVGPRLTDVLALLAGFPAGVNVDALSFDPAFFEFSEEIHPIDADALHAEDLSPHL